MPLPNQLLLIEPKKLAVVFFAAGDFDLLLVDAEVEDEEDDRDADAGGCWTASAAARDAETFDEIGMASLV